MYRKNRYEYTGIRELFIISVSEFLHGTFRATAAKDGETIRKVLVEKLHFTCRMENPNLIGRVDSQIAQDGIKRIIEQDGVRKQAGCDMIAICIMSHGMRTANGQQILFSDGIFISLEDLIAPILECPELIGCPKLFFLQTCRGDFNNHQGQYQADNPIFDPHQDRNFHSTRDKFIFYSSSPGNSAWCHQQRGSLFINHLANALKEYGRTEDLEFIARTVNKTLSAEDEFPAVKNPNTAPQQINVVLAPAVEHCLRFPVYFENQEDLPILTHLVIQNNELQNQNNDLQNETATVQEDLAKIVNQNNELQIENAKVRQDQTRMQTNLQSEFNTLQESTVLSDLTNQELEYKIAKLQSNLTKSLIFSIIAILVAAIMLKWNSKFNPIITQTSGDVDNSGVPAYSQWSPAYSITNNLYHHTKNFNLANNQENDDTKDLIIAEYQEQLRSLKNLLNLSEDGHKKNNESDITSTIRSPHLLTLLWNLFKIVYCVLPIISIFCFGIVAIVNNYQYNPNSKPYHVISLVIFASHFFVPTSISLLDNLFSIAELEYSIQRYLTLPHKLAYCLVPTISVAGFTLVLVEIKREANSVPETLTIVGVIIHMYFFSVAVTLFGYFFAPSFWIPSIYGYHSVFVVLCFTIPTIVCPLLVGLGLRRNPIIVGKEEPHSVVYGIWMSICIILAGCLVLYDLIRVVYYLIYIINS